MRLCVRCSKLLVLQPVLKAFARDFVCLLALGQRFGRGQGHSAQAWVNLKPQAVKAFCAALLGTSPSSPICITVIHPSSVPYKYKHPLTALDMQSGSASQDHCSLCDLDSPPWLS